MRNEWIRPKEIWRGRERKWRGIVISNVEWRTENRECRGQWHNGKKQYIITLRPCNGRRRQRHAAATAAAAAIDLLLAYILCVEIDKYLLLKTSWSGFLCGQRTYMLHFILFVRHTYYTHSHTRRHRRCSIHYKGQKMKYDLWNLVVFSSSFFLLLHIYFDRNTKRFVHMHFVIENNVSAIRSFFLFIIFVDATTPQGKDAQAWLVCVLYGCLRCDIGRRMNQMRNEKE